MQVNCMVDLEQQQQTKVLVKEDVVFLGEIPLMTSGGDIINGSEKLS